MMKTLYMLGELEKDNSKVFECVGLGGENCECYTGVCESRPVTSDTVIFKYGETEEPLMLNGVTLAYDWKERCEKDPYKDWCTVDDIKALGIELEVDQKVMCVDKLGGSADARHLHCLSDKTFLVYDSGKTSFTFDHVVPCLYIRLVK